MTEKFEAPFPWFGGKRRVAADVWERFGTVRNFVEPFYGSGAVLLGRPDHRGAGSETVNDLDGFVCNVWRALAADPDGTAKWAENPVNENDLHARHVWLVERRESLRASLEGDPDFFDPKIAGWWLWGIACWIGSGWCSGKGPWWIDADRKLVHLGNDGQGVKRQLVHLGGGGRGVNRKRVHLGNEGQGDRLVPWFRALAERMAQVRVASGDWSRVCGPSVTWLNGLTAVFLDPPYADTSGRDADLYRVDSGSVAHDVREWAIEQGQRPDMRIALCGYEGEHVMPDDWEVLAWKTHGGYGWQATDGENPNAERERIWFSPACLRPDDWLMTFEFGTGRPPRRTDEQNEKTEVGPDRRISFGEIRAVRQGGATIGRDTRRRQGDCPIRQSRGLVRDGPRRCPRFGRSVAEACDVRMHGRGGMTTITANDPFGSAIWHHRAVGRGKKRRIEAWITPGTGRWRFPAIADIRGTGPDLETACRDFLIRAMAVVDISITDDVTFRVGMSACTSNVTVRMSVDTDLVGMIRDSSKARR